MNKMIRTKPYYKGVTRDFESPTHRTKLVYQPGTTVTTETLNKNADEDCAEGIHFVASVAAALRWGPVVVEIRVPEGKTIVDSGSKLRAKTVEVGDVVSLSGVDLSGAYLIGTNLIGADLSRADLSRADLSGADLFGADLFGADLFGANLYEANLYGARVNGRTIIDLPDGWKIEDGVIVRDA